jgi:2-succinyl-6-hydroxy-2,4-cyclohexadiene-1-carboxylate synthase
MEPLVKYNQSPKFTTIHGFLGAPSDFHPLLGTAPGFEVDLFGRHKLLSHESKEQWLERVAKIIKENAPDSAVIAYSLGARIALELLNRSPELFSKLALISPNPGIQIESERVTRLAADEAWAKRFDSEPLEKVLTDWNKQPVFAGSKQRTNLPTNDSSVIAENLRTFSLAHQPDFRPLIALHAKKIVWIVGALDTKFKNIAEELSRTVPGLKVVIVDGSGHRVIWDRPEAIKEASRLLGLRIS